MIRIKNRMKVRNGIRHYFIIFILNMGKTKTSIVFKTMEVKLLMTNVY